MSRKIQSKKHKQPARCKRKQPPSSAPGIITFTVLAGFISLSVMAWDRHVRLDTPYDTKGLEAMLEDKPVPLMVALFEDDGQPVKYPRGKGYYRKGM